MNMKFFIDRAHALTAVLVSALVLSACGGAAPGGATDSTGGGTNPPVSGVPTMTLALTDESGKSTTTVSASVPGVLVATVTRNNQPVANALVAFAVGGQSLATLSPTSGTALTDASGKATIKLQAASVTSEGATSVTATATIGSGASASSATAGINFQVLPSSVTLQSVAVAPTTIPALGVATVSVSVAGVPTTVPVKVNFTSTCVAQGLAAFSAASVVSSGGNAATTYTDKGCGTQDTIVVTGDGVATPVTTSLTVLGVPANSVLSVALALTNSAGASTTAISLNAPATVAATVLRNGQPVSDALVQFQLGAAAGTVATLSPASGTALTNAAGRASVLLSAASATAQGATSVTASVTLGGQSANASANFQVNTTPISLANMVVSPSTIVALGTAQVEVSVTGVPTSVPISVGFSSSCAGTGRATLTSSALTVNGIATATYTDKGCGTQDTITATAAGATQSASSVLTIQPAPPTAIQFESATPPTIAIVGSGGPGSSFVTFKVVNSAQQPVGNYPVRLELITSPGGVTIDNVAGSVVKNTAQDGTVSVSVAAGSQPGPVRVRATAVDNPALTALSSVLAVQTGLPTQSRFSLSVQTFNIEGWDVDGTQTTVTIRAADRVGNPVPDGTRVNFRTSGAAIQPSCLTAGGSCTVSFVSQNSRPTTPLPNGRVRILAWAAGEESFQDLNGDNRYNSGEPFGDLGDPFVDAGFDGGFTAENDEFIPFNAAAAQACAAPPVNLGFPSRPLTCDGVWGAAFVRQWQHIVLSGSAPGAITLPSTVQLAATAPNCGGSFSFRLFDVNQNPMPAGTTISATSANGEVAAEVVGTPVVSTTGVIPGLQSTNPADFGTGVGVNLSSTSCSGNRSKATTLLLKITSPLGLTTSIGGIQLQY